MAVKYLGIRALVSLLEQICIKENLRYIGEGIRLIKVCQYGKSRGDEWLVFEDNYPIKFDVYVIRSRKVHFTFYCYDEEKEKYVEIKRFSYLYENGQLTLIYKRG